MTDWRSSDDPSTGGYQGPPSSGQHDQPTYPVTPPGYSSAQPGYPQQGYPTPGYPPPGYGGYPAPGYPLGYPPAPAPGDRRPGTLTAAAVLGYVAAGLLVVAGVLLFFGASTIQGFNNAFGNQDTSYTAEFVLAGVANLIAAGLLIAGSVSMTGRNTTGRLLYVVGSGIVIVATIYWLARWATKFGAEGLIVYGLLFAALVIIGTSLAFTSDGNRWLAHR